MCHTQLGLPELPSNFLPEGGAESKVQGDVFPVNFFTPHSVIARGAQVRAGAVAACWARSMAQIKSRQTFK
jgi:hypothetical protein